jgi:hypothetical protein
MRLSSAPAGLSHRSRRCLISGEVDALGRTLPEAREMLRLAEDAKLMHGYLENQVFSSALQRGKDIVWRRVVPVIQLV